MSLQVWLPLNGNLNNQGLFQLPTSPSTNGITYTDGKIGRATSGYCVYHLSSEIVQNKWSLACWCYSSAWGQYNDILLCNNTKGSDDCRFYFSIIGGSKLNMGINGQASASFGFQFSTNTWYHVAATYDGANYALYINGNKVKSGQCTTAMVSNKLNLGIGGRSTNENGTSATGASTRLNDVRIYDHALSAKEVKEISKGLVLHYPLTVPYEELNLIKNGNGKLGSENWYKSSIYDEVPDSSDAVKSFSDNNETRELVPFSPSITYKIELYLKAIGTSGNTYPSIMPYDIDKNFISCHHTAEGFYSDTLTTLTQDLNPGDTKIYVADLSKWSTGSNHAYSVAIFGYKDSYGYTYPDLVYTRYTFEFGTYDDKSNLDKTNNIITLKSAYSGKKVLAGTSICQTTYGSTYFYPFGGVPKTTITDWTKKSGTFSRNHPRLKPAEFFRYMAYSGAYHADIKITIDASTTQTEYDCSGFGYNGTKINTLKQNDEAPRYNSCYTFGTTSSKIKLPVINFSNFGNSYTFSWWQKNQSSGNMAWGFSDGNRLNLYQTTYLCWNTGDGSSNPFKDLNGTSVPNSVLCDNAWHHCAIVGNGQTSLLYVDGVKIGTATTYKALTGTQIYISGWDSGTNYTFSGSSLSDFRIYATALSAEDIKELYNSSAVIDNKGNVYAYEFKE